VFVQSEAAFGEMQEERRMDNVKIKIYFKNFIGFEYGG
jgi:hypothetical protein